ncbi:MAG: SOS response-associated peptidase family protein [Atopobiaceae bacterium]
MCHRVAPVLFKELQLALDLYAQTGHARIPRDNPVPKDVYPGAKLATIVLAQPGESTESPAPLTSNSLPTAALSASTLPATALPSNALSPTFPSTNDPSPRLSSSNPQAPRPLQLKAQEFTWGFSRQGDGPNEQQFSRTGRSADHERAAGSWHPAASGRPASSGRPTSPKRRLVFNTRLDTALYQLHNGRGMWAEPIARGRCLVPVRAFYESWTRSGSPDPTGKSEVRFSMNGHGIFLLAAVASANEVSIVTTEPNADVGRVHSRMPLVLGPGESSIWLGPDFAQLADRSSIHLAAELVAPPAPASGRSQAHSRSQAQSRAQAQLQNQTLFPE